ncbi:MAG: ketoacyl-ACP synthase III [Magnetococcales bacterium]|nr:ketoacyl-ACP synthase III [Magnetococcales bacterium]
MRRLNRARITGTGSYLPERRLTNDDISKMVDTTDEWIRTRTGVCERRLAAEDELTSDLATHAARNAMEAAGVTAQQVDLVLVATTTPDMIFPSTASIVQKKLGANLSQGPAFDLQAVCSGFIYALSVADQFIATGAAKCALVIGAETFTRILDWTDRNTCVLFGDGAGAVVLQPEPEGSERGILSTHLHADGDYVDLLKVPTGVSNNLKGGVNAAQAGEPPPPRQILGYTEMRGNEVFKKAVMGLGQLVDETLAANGLEKSDLDWLVPHQANMRIIKSTAKRLKMGLENVVVTVDRHGNTSAASVPLALDEAVRDGRIQPGHLVLMEAFGGGFTWGSALVRW